MKTSQICTRVLVAVGLCLTLGACGGGDDGSDSSNDRDSDTNTEDPGGPGGNDDSSSSNQQSQQESECSSSSDCEPVVCDCPEGPVNFQGCSVVNDIGTCATEDTCSASACD